MIGFHIDMNAASFTKKYLQKWLRAIANAGYDTIIWEVENNIQWDSYPECVSPEAFTKSEFKELLDLCRELNLESIPVLQTLGHCEYVLLQPEYKHLAECPDRVDQYCPQNPQLVPFLERWINEYLELFEGAEKFHIGADEAWTLGSCDKCRTFAEKHSLSKLFVNHINKISAILIQKDIQPIIWADMLLHHNDAIHELSREIMLFDWQYDIRKSEENIWIWGDGLRQREQLDKTKLSRFWKYIFPSGDEPGQAMEPFYTADYLADHGFEVVTCPSSSSCGDSLFAPRSDFHLSNIFDSVRKGSNGHLAGSVLTSWTMHIFPYELQIPAIQLPAYALGKKDGTLESFKKQFEEKTFGATNGLFFKACNLLAMTCPFAEAKSLGFEKSLIPVNGEFIQQTVGKMDPGKLEELIETCRKCTESYSKAHDLFEEFSRSAQRGQGQLDLWIFASKNLMHRVKSISFIATCRVNEGTNHKSPQKFLNSGKELVVELNDLQLQMSSQLAQSIKPIRKKLILERLYKSLENALRHYTTPHIPAIHSDVSASTKETRNPQQSIENNLI